MHSVTFWLDLLIWFSLTVLHNEDGSGSVWSMVFSLYFCSDLGSVVSLWGFVLHCHLIKDSWRGVSLLHCRPCREIQCPGIPCPWGAIVKLIADFLSSTNEKHRVAQKEASRIIHCLTSWDHFFLESHWSLSLYPLHLNCSKCYQEDLGMNVKELGLTEQAIHWTIKWNFEMRAEE